MAIILAVNAVSLCAYNRMIVNSEGTDWMNKKGLLFQTAFIKKVIFAFRYLVFYTCQCKI